MEIKVEKLINEQKQKTVSLITLEKRLKKRLGDEVSPWFYKELANAILALEEKDIIEPFKNAKTYSRDARIKEKYKKKKAPMVDEKTLKQELLTSFHQNISVSYYLKHLEEYHDMKEKVKMISEFLKGCYENMPYLSVNERSYEIFEEEKFLASKEGKKLLANLKLSLETLYCYETYEPFFHIGIARTKNENILIVENKDTYFSIKKLFLENIHSWDNIKFSMIIYGEGNKITRSYEYLDELGVPDVNIYYFGDFDREGIAIYHRLQKISERSVKIVKSFYLRMFNERKNKPAKDQYWNKEAIKNFFKENKFRDEKIMKDYLAAGKYVPQEAVNIEILRRMADGATKTL